MRRLPDSHDRERRRNERDGYAPYRVRPALRSDSKRENLVHVILALAALSALLWVGLWPQ